MIKTFRGLLLDAAQHRIRLSTKQGKIGYRIVNFQLMFVDLATSIKSVVKIFKVKQDSMTGTIDFSDHNMLACGILSGKADQTAYPEDMLAVFEQEIFNQDIYITHVEVAGTASINYYLELEVMNLSDNEAAVSTLMDIRSSA
jgi:hypothetical protein